MYVAYARKPFRKFSVSEAAISHTQREVHVCNQFGGPVHIMEVLLSNLLIGRQNTLTFSSFHRFQISATSCTK